MTREVSAAGTAMIKGFELDPSNPPALSSRRVL